jgi:hypothetical protein
MCVLQYAHITYTLELRRKPLFYTVNLITPCVLMTALSVLSFYIPVRALLFTASPRVQADSRNKIALCASILVSMEVFFLFCIEIMPPNSRGDTDSNGVVNHLKRRVVLSGFKLVVVGRFVGLPRRHSADYV